MSHKNPLGYWNDTTKHKPFLDDLAKKLNFIDLRGWHTLSRSILQEHGGYGLVQKYEGSISKMLTSVYPEYKDACREEVIRIVHDRNLSKVEELVKVSTEYLILQY